MQVLASKCPYCGQVVETTIDHLDEPIICPSCNRPFEMEIPTVQVTSVREVEDGAKEGMGALATEPRERVLFEVHPVVLRVRPFSTLLVILIAAAACFGLWTSLAAQQADVVTWISIAALVGVTIAVGYWYLLRISTTLTVTDSRTIFRRGIISRETSEVQHDDVRNIQLDQSLVERMLNIGDIAISSSGQDDLEIVAPGIASPDRVVDAIRQNQE